MGISTNLRCSRVFAPAHRGPRSAGSPWIPHTHSEVPQPHTQTEVPQPHTQTEVPEPEYPMLRNRLTALIIDGSEFQRIYHKTLLSSFYVDVWEAKNGYEAFGLILDGIEFDVIFIDMDLPVLNGTETTRILRRAGIGCMIVGIAAYVNRSRDQRVFRQSGVDYYHERMFTYERLFAILRRLDDEI